MLKIGVKAAGIALPLMLRRLAGQKYRQPRALHHHALGNVLRQSQQVIAQIHFAVFRQQQVQQLLHRRRNRKS